MTHLNNGDLSGNDWETPGVTGKEWLPWYLQAMWPSVGKVNVNLSVLLHRVIFKLSSYCTG